jgi:hypothetical protein
VLSCKQKLSKPKHVPEFRDYVELFFSYFIRNPEKTTDSWICIFISFIRNPKEILQEAMVRCIE